MPDVKFVIGANYGDEGKGLMSAYFANEAAEQGKKCLTVLYNGGPQRGHTVETRRGFRKVYHHFAAGSSYWSDTYFHEDFLVNPMTFLQEYDNEPCAASPNCRVITPFDMMVNQMKEQGRGNSRHGSCGMGIFETITRYKNDPNFLKFGDIFCLGQTGIFNYLTDVQRYYENRGFRFDVIPGLNVNGLKRNWARDMIDFCNLVTLWHDPKNMMDKYDTIIFEGGQGLALDMDNMDDFPHLTPSNTGSKRMIPWIKGMYGADTPIEITYVSRSYLTRHGNGPFPDACLDMTHIEQDMTNQPNPWQGTLRLSGFNKGAFRQMGNRIQEDMAKVKDAGMTNVRYNFALTHVNENPDFHYPFGDIFDYVFLSDTKYVEDVVVAR